jgi:DNA-binding Lrp family transcriptional regulator
VIADQLARDQTEVIARLQTLTAAGVVPRIGVIVRHRAIGWRSNAMVVWDVPPPDVDRAGAILASAPGINLCYRRTRHERDWPYNLYCMVHAKAREDALESIVAAQRLAGLDAYSRQVLFSLRCYKQTGAMVALPKEAA